MPKNNGTLQVEKRGKKRTNGMDLDNRGISS